MASENEITEELKVLKSPLAGLSGVMPFEIPQHYFDGLESRITAGVMASENDQETILSLSKEIPFEIPEHYFEDSAGQITAIAGLPANDAAGFEVPQGYFESLSGRVLTALHTENTAGRKPKVIAFNPLRRVAQWAAAAVLVLGIGIGSYHVYNTPDLRAQHQLARVDGESINDYVSQNVVATSDAIAMNAPAASAVKTLSNDEITSYLDETGYEDATATD